MLPRAVFVVGALACLLLVATLPLVAIVGGLIVLALGIVFRLAIRLAIRRRGA